MTSQQTNDSSTSSAETQSLLQRIEQEDLVLFINACFTCTRQREFYSGKDDQKLSIRFLHEYIGGNYRRLYARTLATGINHFNKMMIILHLLHAGAPQDVQQRREEGELIFRGLCSLPKHRALKTLQWLRHYRVNNRRTRAITKRFLNESCDLEFHTVKYRTKLRSIVSHTHLALPNEIERFLFHLQRQRRFETELFERFREANYSEKAVYRLPFTIAEGLANKHRIPRDRFLQEIATKMTTTEKMRLQNSSKKSKTDLHFDLKRAALTKLAIYILSLSREVRLSRMREFDDALSAAAHRALERSSWKPGNVAVVLDSSYSSYGSSEKRRRPLAVALAIHYLVCAAVESTPESDNHKSYHRFWTSPPIRHNEETIDLLVTARGTTAIADKVLDALSCDIDLLLIVSDGFENDPPDATNSMIQAFRKKLASKRKIEILHVNPVFDAENFQPRRLGPSIPTVGIRDAEDLPTMHGFARFASGHAKLAELESQLESYTQEMLSSALKPKQPQLP